MSWKDDISSFTKGTSPYLLTAVFTLAAAVATVRFVPMKSPTIFIKTSDPVGNGENLNCPKDSNVLFTRESHFNGDKVDTFIWEKVRLDGVLASPVRLHAGCWKKLSNKQLTH